MPTSLSPELVLVLPESQRAAAIQALPMPEVWSPGPLGPPLRVAQRGTTHSLVANALLYFGAKLVWTIASAALYVLAAVAIVVVLTLLF
jgi:hypothetical protein